MFALRKMELTCIARSAYHEAAATAETLIPCALKFKAPVAQERTPIHLMLLIDISESMNEEKRLQNVKECVKIVTNFLTDHDHISLVTFGNTSTIHLQEVPATDVQKQSIRETVNLLSVDGCTNLSAGLGYIRKILEEVRQPQLKQGLLILTDGHANRGATRPNELYNMLNSLHDFCPMLSVHSIGYGQSHNGELLRGFAECTQGSYAIVNSMEDTAFAFGDTIGGLMTCAFQNVTLQISKGAVAKGPYANHVKVNPQTGQQEVPIGDIYSGTESLILLDIPAGDLRIHGETPCLTIRGMRLPSLEWFHGSQSWTLQSERDLSIELTELRYECSSLLKRLALTDAWQYLTQLRADVEKFNNKLQDSFLEGQSHPVHGSLKQEVVIMKQLLERLANHGQMDVPDIAYLQQHTTYIGLGRGFSSPMARNRRQRAPATAPGASSVIGSQSVQEDPVVHQQEDESVPIQAAFQNDVQTQLASLMRSMSMGQSDEENMH